MSPQFDAACSILQVLRAQGHAAYLAGGCVRDLLLGRVPKDYDVATSATPEVVLSLFERTFAVGAHFGVVLVSQAEFADLDGRPSLTEVATFRNDGVYLDGRHPDAVRYTTSAEEDVARRDFTVNGLLLDPLAGCANKGDFPQGLKPIAYSFANVRAEARPLHRTLPESDSFPKNDGSEASSVSLRTAVLDYVGGLADLNAGLIRAIGEPVRRFDEDALRLLRAVRFAARLGFAIEPKTQAAMRAMAGRIAAVSRERVRDELTRMLTEGNARRAFELLDETGLLAEVLPEVDRMKGVEQPPQYHPEGDVWLHTLGLLGQLEAGCPATLAWGALLHDVGKPATFRVAERIRFDGHVEVGVAISAAILGRFRFSNEDTRQVLALVENHMRFGDVTRMKQSTLKRFFRLERFAEHLALHRMDCLAGSGNLENWAYARERYEALAAEQVSPAPLITGRELIAAGYQPGERFKQMLRAVEDAQLEGLIHTAAEAMALVRERFGDA